MAALRKAVEASGGEVHKFDAPKARELPSRLVEEARRRGFELEPAAARVLIDRMGEGTLRLRTELDRLALWAEPGDTVTAGDLEAMIADTSEEAAWTLSDALVARDPQAAVKAAERLLSQGESVTALVYQAAKRLREAHGALSAIEAGAPQKEVESSLRMHPYAAKMLLRKVRATSPGALRAATCAVADLEWWSRGGADYPDDVALTLSVRRAVNAG